jgi:hypothetical protein
VNTHFFVCEHQFKMQPSAETLDQISKHGSARDISSKPTHLSQVLATLQRELIRIHTKCMSSMAGTACGS